MKILLIEDSKDIADWFVQDFNQKQHTTTVVSNRKTAEDQITKRLKNFDAIIADHQIETSPEDKTPVKCGADLVNLAAVLSNRHQHKIPIIFWSTQANPADVTEAVCCYRSRIPLESVLPNLCQVIEGTASCTEIGGTCGLKLLPRMTERARAEIYEVCYDILSPFLCLAIPLELFFDTTAPKHPLSSFLPTEDGWDYWAELEFQRREVQAHKIPELEALLSQVGELPDNVQAALNNLKVSFNDSTEEESKAGVEKPLQRICEILADYPAGATRHQAILEGYNNGQQSVASFNVLVEELETASQAIREILEFIEESVP